VKEQYWFAMQAERFFEFGCIGRGPPIGASCSFRRTCVPWSSPVGDLVADHRACAIVVQGNFAAWIEDRRLGNTRRKADGVVSPACFGRLTEFCVEQTIGMSRYLILGFAIDWAQSKCHFESSAARSNARRYNKEQRS
jgi:hypothetical protein